MAEMSLPAQRRFGQTMRPDVWWLQPLAVFLGFSAFIVYSTWAAFHPVYNGNCAYWYNGGGANYLSPFFSPKHFGLGIGSLVLILNVIFLSCYTFGCHSLRHLVGGFLDQVSKKPTCAKAYSCVSCLNKRHMMWAWISLFWVGFTDVYVRLCAMGIWHDIKIF